MLHTSEQFARENVVHGATDRRKQREVQAALTSTGGAEEVRRTDPQRVEKSGPTAGENKSEPTRCCSGDHSPDQQFDGETVENKISQSTVQDVRGQNKTRLREVTSKKKQTIQSTLPAAVIKTSLRTREKTVEFQQMHDIDKIVRRCCVETEEGLNGPNRMKPWQRRLRKRIWFSTSTESWTYQWTRSLLMLKTPDHVARSATVMRKRSLIFLLMVLRGLLFKHRQLKTLQKVMTQKVKVSVTEQPAVLRRYARESRGAD